MEPARARAKGSTTLDWLTRAIRWPQRHHIAVVIGTPTDAPPAWLTEPLSARRCASDPTAGRAEHGGRRQFSYSSPRYRSFCRDIVEQLAQRFGHDPDVIGWQIDNEYTDESFDAETPRAVPALAAARSTAPSAALNAAWTTAYWSQTYTAWSRSR